MLTVARSFRSIKSSTLSRFRNQVNGRLASLSTIVKHRMIIKPRNDEFVSSSSPFIDNDWALLKPSKSESIKAPPLADFVWNHSSLRKEALKYHSIWDFKIGNRNAYKASQNLGVLKAIGKDVPSWREWTKDELIIEAKKYKTVQEFKLRSSCAYITAQSNLWLDDICQHMPPLRREWTHDLLIKEGLKYKSRNVFQRKSQDAYQTARRSLFLDYICQHMPIPIIWTDQMLATEAKRFNTITEFHNESYDAYNTARRRGILENICYHMELSQDNWTDEDLKLEAAKYKTRRGFHRGNYEAYDIARQKGITDNICRHMPSPRIWTNEELKVEALKYETLVEFHCGNYDAYDASYRSMLDEVCKHMIPLSPSKNIPSYPESVIFKCRKSIMKTSVYCPWSKLILLKNSSNKAQVSATIWSEDLLKSVAMKYQTKTEFRLSNKRAYAAAYTRGIIPEICKHMKVVTVQTRKWTNETIMSEAVKYTSKKEFLTNNRSAYFAAYKQGILDQVCLHMLPFPKTFWTDESLRNEALKYVSKAEFRKHNSGAYQTLMRKGILDEIFEHMNTSTTNRTYDGMKMEALKYTTKAEFRTKSPQIYRKAYTKGLLSLICQHMPRITQRKWTKDNVKIEALKYNSIQEFRRIKPKVYYIAVKHGWLNDVCQHMGQNASVVVTSLAVAKTKESVIWSHSTLQLEALKYSSRTEFYKGNRQAYTVARKKGLLDEICQSYSKKHPRVVKKQEWTHDELIQIASKYPYPSAFKNNKKYAYTAALNAGILDSVFKKPIFRKATG